MACQGVNLTFCTVGPGHSKQHDRMERGHFGKNTRAWARAALLTTVLFATATAAGQNGGAALSVFLPPDAVDVAYSGSFPHSQEFTCYPLLYLPPLQYKDPTKF